LNAIRRSAPNTEADTTTTSATTSAATTGYNGTGWSFTLLDTAIEGATCPTKCGSSLESCGVCLRLGNGLRGRGRASRIFHVSNVFYDDGAWFLGSQREQDRVVQCGGACDPSWENENWYQNLYAGGRHQTQVTKHEPDIRCEPSHFIMEPALLVQWVFPQNVYHFYTDTILTTFMTVGYIARTLGHRPLPRIFIVSGCCNTVLKDIWELLFGPIRWANEMKGCYKDVFYGHMVESVPVVDWPTMIHDPSLALWISAFRMNSMPLFESAGWLKASPGDTEVGAMLWVAHARAPEWFQSINWTVPGVNVQPVDFAVMSLSAQIRQVSMAMGLLGVAGSGLAHQFWLRPRSLILMVHLLETGPEDPLGKRSCYCRMSKLDIFARQVESSGMCYVNSAINIGNIILAWRWCRPDILNATSAFTSQHAQAVFQKAMSFQRGLSISKMAGACLVAEGNTSSTDWPRCDEDVKVTTHRAEERYEPFGYIGRPFNIVDNTSFTPLGDGISFTPSSTFSAH